MKTTVYLGKRQPTVNFSYGAHAFAFSGQRGYNCISEKSVYCAESFTKFERRSQDLSEFLGAGEEEDFAFAKTLGSPCSKPASFLQLPQPLSPGRREHSRGVLCFTLRLASQ